MVSKHEFTYGTMLKTEFYTTNGEKEATRSGKSVNLPEKAEDPRGKLIKIRITTIP